MRSKNKGRGTVSAPVRSLPSFFEVSRPTVDRDTFWSKHTKGWNVVKKAAPVKIFYKGDECDPFVSCVDIIAFLVDDTIAARKLKLFPDDVKSTLESHTFDKTVHFFDSHSLNHCVWKTDQMINVSGRLARPVVFLSIDQFATKSGGLEDDT